MINTSIILWSENLKVIIIFTYTCSGKILVMRDNETSCDINGVEDHVNDVEYQANDAEHHDPIISSSERVRTDWLPIISP